MKTAFISYGNTKILLGLDEQNLVPEWQPRGYIVKRQVYENMPPSWYAYEILPDERGVVLVRSAEPDENEAVRALVESVTGSGRA